jgi:H+-translocating NAD(P) transhydrogenase subunit alpha
METNVPLIIKQASEISELSANLTEKLKDLATYGTENAATGADPFVFALTIFTLACFVGYYVVWKVTPSLHTPLMSVTNAISGIIVIGSIIASSAEFWNVSSLLGLVAIFVASINIFGGFIVTMRMLSMFKKK